MEHMMTRLAHPLDIQWFFVIVMVHVFTWRPAGALAALDFPAPQIDIGIRARIGSYSDVIRKLTMSWTVFSHIGRMTIETISTTFSPWFAARTIHLTSVPRKQND